MAAWNSGPLLQGDAAQCRSCSERRRSSCAPASSTAWARPGGNATGLHDRRIWLSRQMAGAAREIAPGVMRVASLGDPTVAPGRGSLVQFRLWRRTWG